MVDQLFNHLLATVAHPLGVLMATETRSGVAGPAPIRTETTNRGGELIWEVPRKWRKLYWQTELTAVQTDWETSKFVSETRTETQMRMLCKTIYLLFHLFILSFIHSIFNCLISKSSWQQASQIGSLTLRFFVLSIFHSFIVCHQSQEDWWICFFWISRCAAHPGAFGKGQRKAIICSQLTNGRFVFVRLKIREYLTLCEVEVFVIKSGRPHLISLFNVAWLPEPVQRKF